MSAAPMSLAKLLITSYDNRSFSGGTIKQFYTPINPENFSKKFKINADTQQGSGNSGTEVTYSSTSPEELKLDFFLDGTKTIEGYGNIGEGEVDKNGNKKTVSDAKKLSVHEQLEEFLKCVYDMDGKIHRPRFLLIVWGSEIRFRCVLTNLDINYTLFKPDGTPLRVKISATFLAYKTREEREAEARKSSPDLTHFKKVTADSRLDLMTHAIYNDPKYLLQIGKVNGLTSIRNLKSGTDLYFPPFDKH
jgi:hypothetical protein